MAENTIRNSNITISTSTLLWILVSIIGLWIIYVTANILLLVLASIFLAAAVGPWVEKLEQYHLPRSVSMIGIYAILFAVLSSAIILVIPLIAEQVKTIALTFPDLYGKFIDWLTSVSPAGSSTPDQALQNVSNALTTATQGVFSTLSNIFGGIFSFFMVLVMTFYLVVDKDAIKRSVELFHPKHQAYVDDLYARMQKQIGLWLRAQLILMALVGLLTYVLLTLVGMKYALLLAIIAGLTEFIPYLGPMIGAVPAIVLAYAISPTMAGIITLVYYSIQLFENNVLVPKIMERALGLSPIVSIVVFLIGAQLGGIAGSFLSIPIATAANVGLKEILKRRSRRMAKV